MSAPAPLPLPENTGLAFVGEPAWAPARLSPAEARLFATARNACGRPNTDVLGRRLAFVAGALVESTQLDFPPHFTAQEAALYEKPFARLAGQPWLNPHANPDLHRALARVTRFLVTPADASPPAWQWIEDELVPDDSLLAIVRDDDFTHAVLQSAAFAAWWHAHVRILPPVQRIASFPFPWPPATPLGSLTKAQQESRSAAARAGLTGDTDQLNATLAAAYGWPLAHDESEILLRLQKLHAQRMT